MSDLDCFCDYDDLTQAYHAEDHIARIQHKCTECSGVILPGEAYERVRAIWDHEPATCKTCIRCLALREFVTANVKCFCWAHHNMISDALETAQQFGTGSQHGSGLLFGAYRRYVAIRRHKKNSSSTRTLKNTSTKDQQ